MNYNKLGTFGTRPQSAGLKPKGNQIRKPMPKNNFARKGSEAEIKPPLVQPEWNSSVVENPHKLTQAELLKRKMQAKSKHEMQAKQELADKLGKL